MCKILNEIIHLCLHREVTSVKRLPFAQQCEIIVRAYLCEIRTTFEGVPIHGGGGRKYYIFWNIQAFAKKNVALFLAYLRKKQ